MNEDLIRRSDVLNLATCITKPTYDSPYCESVVYVEDIEAIPSVEVEPVRHKCNCHIIMHPYSKDYSIEIDSKSSEISFWEQNHCLAVFSVNYCPNCGAKMDKGVQNDQN